MNQEPFNKYLDRRSYRFSLNSTFDEYEWLMNSQYYSEKFSNREYLLSSNKSIIRDVMDERAFAHGKQL